MRKKIISIIMPIYNEEKTVEKILQKVVDVQLLWEKEIIIVNDASVDSSTVKIKQFLKKNPSIVYIEHPKNAGKGAAVRTGINLAKGDYIVIQDADLEYDPNDIGRMLTKVDQEPGIVVFGSRLTESPILFGANRTPILLHYFGNKFLSLVTSLFFGSWVTDMETCYKLFPKSALQKIELNARGFELEPEITAKLLKNGYKIIEIPISTHPRGYEQGKKLHTWSDGFKAVLALIKYRFTN